MNPVGGSGVFSSSFALASLLTRAPDFLCFLTTVESGVPLPPDVFCFLTAAESGVPFPPDFFCFLTAAESGVPLPPVDWRLRFFETALDDAVVGFPPSLFQYFSRILRALLWTIFERRKRCVERTGGTYTKLSSVSQVRSDFFS